jgi:hypothetical protein
MATAGLGAFYVGLTAAAEWMDAKQTKGLAQTGKAMQLTTISQAVGQGNMKGVWKALGGQDLGLMSGGQLDTKKTQQLIERLEYKDRLQMAASLGINHLAQGARFKGAPGSGPLGIGTMDIFKSGPQLIAEEIAKRIMEIPRQGGSGLPSWASPVFGPALPEGELAKPGKQVNNFYGGIQVKQDFLNKDPDNIWVQMKEDIERGADRRRQAQSSDPFSM